MRPGVPAGGVGVPQRRDESYTSSRKVDNSLLEMI
jgi:hypothetical protein